MGKQYSILLRVLPENDIRKNTRQGFAICKCQIWEVELLHGSFIPSYLRILTVTLGATTSPQECASTTAIRAAMAIMNSTCEL